MQPTNLNDLGIGWEKLVGHEKKKKKKTRLGMKKNFNFFRTISILNKLKCFCINVKQKVYSLKCDICFSKVAKVIGFSKVHVASLINYKKFLAYLRSLPFST